jgi:hypothetical protein
MTETLRSTGEIFRWNTFHWSLDAVPIVPKLSRQQVLASETRVFRLWASLYSIRIDDLHPRVTFESLSYHEDSTPPPTTNGWVINKGFTIARGIIIPVLNTIREVKDPTRIGCFYKSSVWTPHRTILMDTPGRFDER